MISISLWRYKALLLSLLHAYSICCYMLIVQSIQCAKVIHVQLYIHVDLSCYIYTAVVLTHVFSTRQYSADT